MKKIGVVITDGVGFRNFILTDFIYEISKKASVTIYSCLPKESYRHLVLDAAIQIHELPLYNESKLVWFFRKVKELAHLQRHKTYFGFQDALKANYPSGFSIRALLVRMAFLISYCFHSEKAILFFEQLQFYISSFSTTAKGYAKFLSNDAPDLLFFTHQRPPFIAPLLYAAKKAGIQTTAFIFSWDNLSSKGRMMGNFDTYFVWSNHMKNELLYFYPHTKTHTVFVVGTPQFEPYVLDRYKQSKDDFFTKFELDSSKKLICFSCADASIGKNDAVYIESIYKYIQEKSANSLQLLVRTSPAEDGSRFASLMAKYPSIKWHIPTWHLTRSNHTENWSQRVPTIEDLIDLRSILTYAAVNVNMCSTMSLDFMLFNKPVINTVFGNAINGLYDDQRFLKYQHYKTVVDSGAVSIALTEKELHDSLDKALNEKDDSAFARKQLLALEIGQPLEATSKRIAMQLITLVTLS